jgi:hypothetical protein
VVRLLRQQTPELYLPTVGIQFLMQQVLVQAQDVLLQLAVGTEAITE